MAKPFTAGDARIDDGGSYRDPAAAAWQSRWRFPFDVFDQTPGGRNLGRIEWCMELLKGGKTNGRRPIGGVAIWARQTRDPRYAGTVFHLPAHTDAITTHSDRADFVKHVWHAGFCEVHGNIILTAYPPSGHGMLVVDLSLSISSDIYFERTV